MADLQSTEYGSKTGVEGDGKLQTSGSLAMIKGGGSGDGSGPTGSKRTYPKGSRLSLTPDFNPQKVPATDYGVGGV